MKIEKMDEFFEKRVDRYEEHMLTNVIGCREAYAEMARQIPESCEMLLDLGCGTGLELDEIFKRLPNVSVTGIDMTQAMLERLKKKHGNKSLNLIHGNYFNVDFGMLKYDCAISFQTMHHFSHADKISLYKKVFNSLKSNGIYVECDYMVETQEEEDFYYAENSRIRKELGILRGEFYHYDTPCTIKNQISMLNQAGFNLVENVFRMENTTILTASVS